MGYFDLGFKTNSKGNRAVAIAKESGMVQAKWEQGIIHGFVKGGLTGIDNMDTYDKADNEKATGSISNNEVLSQYYYFWMWIPKDTNIGFIVLQFNNSIVRGIAQPFFQHIYEWFESCKFHFDKTTYMPREMQDRFLKDCNVVSVKGIKYIKSDEFSPMQGEQNLKKLSVIKLVSGLSFPFSDFMRYHFSNNTPSTRLLDLLQYTDSEDLNLSVECRNGSEKKTYKLTSDNGILPQILVDNLLISNHPTKDSVTKLYHEIEIKYLPFMKAFLQKTE